MCLISSLPAPVTPRHNESHGESVTSHLLYSPPLGVCAPSGPGVRPVVLPHRTTALRKLSLTKRKFRITFIFVSEPVVNQQAIAEHLNVSVATVSKALRDSPEISPATRARVAQAAAELGYRRDRGRTVARTRRSAQSLMVAALLHRPLNHGTGKSPEYLDGLCEAAAALDLSLVVQQYSFRAPVDELVTDPSLQPPAMREGHVNGIVLGGAWPISVVQALSSRYPCVCFPHDISDLAVDVIGLDNVGTVTRIVRHLAQLGHEKIGFLGRCNTMAWASERFAGYVNALSSLDLAYDPDLVVDIAWEPLLNEGFEDVWHEAVDRIDRCRRAGVRAWVCSSDWPAYQLFRGMLDRGVRVPQDISITGFDDTEPVNLGCPPVTSIRLPRAAMGHAAMRRLHFRLEHPQTPVGRMLFAGEFMDHGTTAMSGTSQEVCRDDDVSDVACSTQ